MKKIYIILALVSAFVMNSQNYGRITVIGKDNQQFIISYNGVRCSNDYTNKSVLNYAEDTDYKVRVLLPRNTNPINFNITNSIGYETVYILEKDQYDAYALTLESKVKFNANSNPSNPTPTVIATPTIAPTPSVAAIVQMADADFKAKLASVKNESFDDKKMVKLNFLFKDEYLSSVQAAELVKLFSFDTKKVDAGKSLYKRTVDKKNYYKVVDVITFDSYKKDLQDWIMKIRNYFVNL